MAQYIPRQSDNQPLPGPNFIQQTETFFGVLEGQISNLSGDLETLGQTILQASGELSALTSEVGEVKSKAGVNAADIESLQSGLTALAGSIGSVETTLADALEDIETLETSLTEISGKANANEGNITALSGLITTAQSAISTAQSNIITLQSGLSQAQSDIAALQGGGGGSSSGGGSLELTELVKSDVITGDILIKNIPPASPIQMKAGLVKAYQFVADGESAVDVVRSYDNTVASVFEQNDMLVFSSSGTHIKVEFEETSTASAEEGENTIYTFALDLTAIKELEIL